MEHAFYRYDRIDGILMDARSQKEGPWTPPTTDFYEEILMGDFRAKRWFNDAAGVLSDRVRFFEEKGKDMTVLSRRSSPQCRLVDWREIRPRKEFIESHRGMCDLYFLDGGCGFHRDIQDEKNLNGAHDASFLIDLLSYLECLPRLEENKEYSEFRFIYHRPFPLIGKFFSGGFDKVNREGWIRMDIVE